MKRKIDPNKVILGMMPRACAECKSIQHVFFRTQDEYDSWDCPECREKEIDEFLEEPETESE